MRMPIRVVGATTAGDEDDKALTIRQVANWYCATIAASRLGGGEQGQRNPLEGATDFACSNGTLLETYLNTDLCILLRRIFDPISGNPITFGALLSHFHLDSGKEGKYALDQ
jgi:hypothetical protein